MIEGQRLLFSASSEKLRRARRLYYRIARDSVERNPDTAWLLAYRCQERGLFSVKTDIENIVFAICRGCFRCSSLNDWGGFGWYDWLDKYQANDLWHRKSIKIKNGKR